MMANTQNNSQNNWAVVTDFDGTLTLKDIGNELCSEVLGDHWHGLYAKLRNASLDLKSYQKLCWEFFPLSEKAFIEKALRHSELRPGVDEFISKAADHGVPVYVASCGLRPYIETTLKSKLSAKAFANIKDIRCNEVVFSEKRIERFIPPETTKECPYPLDKGAWAAEISASLNGVKLFGIGNGTSDRSFWGHVTELAAIEGLEKWCQNEKHPYIAFKDFFELAQLAPFFK
jgi:2,3-diketo-5-methylthio-1-phosphopentane phosphatase